MGFNINFFRFELGRVVATANLLRYCADRGYSLLPYLSRHARGDWGELCKEDKAANEEALREGLRILSAYALPDGKKIWLITEADRSATTFLFPEDY